MQRPRFDSVLSEVTRDVIMVGDVPASVGYDRFPQCFQDFAGNRIDISNLTLQEALQPTPEGTLHLEEEDVFLTSCGWRVNMSLTMSKEPWEQARWTGVERSSCCEEMMAPFLRHSSTACSAPHVRQGQREST